MSDRKSKLSSSQIASIGAVIISLAALGIGIVQARIMSNQQEIMAKQQKTSVWPYVYVDTKLNLNLNEYSISCTIENKGIGPALVENLKLVFDGKEYTSYNDFAQAIEEKGIVPSSNMSFKISGKGKKVLKPSELQEVFNLKSTNLDNAQLAAFTSIRLQLCYCSVHGDCWRENGTELSDEVACN